VVVEFDMKSVAVASRDISEDVSNYFDPLCHGERWYVVHALPRREVRAQMHLDNQGFRTFLPQHQKTIRHARKFSTVVAPFFPRYLFVVLDMTRHRWRSINGSVGVASLVMQGELPHPVPAGVVETLQAMTDTRGLLRFEKSFRIGDRVRLTAGPLAERLGVCERLDDSGRVRVLLDIMGGQIPVQIESKYLAPAQ
jgi:transcription elongation factor/antiterminator RfaH